METRMEYDLKGYTTCTFWEGGTGYRKLDIITDEDGLNEIMENPLQDFIGFGEASTDYAFFEVFKTEISTTDECRIEKFFYYPVETIEAGNLDESIDTEIIELDEPAIVNF